MGVLPTWLQPARYIESFDLGEWWRPQALPQSGIDLGNGRVLPPEDVLEGHYRRMAQQRAPSISSTSTRQVAVQVGDNLTVAITVLAPDLAPLTEIAEHVSDAVPLIEPTTQFREHLHQALERTHRQHAAARILGMRPAPRPQTALLHWWLVLASVVVTVALWWGWRRQQGDAPAA